MGDETPVAGAGDSPVTGQYRFQPAALWPDLGGRWLYPENLTSQTQELQDTPLCLAGKLYAALFLLFSQNRNR